MFLFNKNEEGKGRKKRGAIRKRVDTRVIIGERSSFERVAY